MDILRSILAGTASNQARLALKYDVAAVSGKIAGISDRNARANSRNFWKLSHLVRFTNAKKAWRLRDNLQGQ